MAGSQCSDVMQSMCLEAVQWMACDRLALTWW